jgi:peptide/nickel transport system substrate-binding protein
MQCRFGSLLVFLLIAAACAPASPATPASTEPSEARTLTPKRITAAIRGDPKVLNENINTAAGGSSSAGVREIELLLNAGLTHLSTRGVPEPLLAEAAPSLENGQWKLLPDGRMETTWKLKPNLQWHDGAPLTVDDFIFAATVARDRSLAMSQDLAFQFVEAVDASDSQTLRVLWKATFAEADRLFGQATNMSAGPMPKHLLGA